MNKFCFIGKNLDKEKITKDLRKCVFEGKVPEPGPVPTTKLTYKVGDRIWCKCAKWEKGTVI